MSGQTLVEVGVHQLKSSCRPIDTTHAEVLYHHLLVVLIGFVGVFVQILDVLRQQKLIHVR